MDGWSQHVNISYKKGQTIKQAGYGYNKCKNEDVIGTKQVYECEINDKQETDSKLNLYKCAVHNNFELYNVYAKSADIERWSILSYKKKIFLQYSQEQKFIKVETSFHHGRQHGFVRSVGKCYT